MNAADTFMEALPVQLAGTELSPQNSSPVSGERSGGGNSFTSTFSVALASLSKSGQGEPSNVPQPASQPKLSGNDRADSSSLAALNCLLTALVAPVTPAAPNSDGQEPVMRGPGIDANAGTATPADSDSTIDSPPTPESGAGSIPGLPFANSGSLGHAWTASANQFAGLTEPTSAGKGWSPLGVGKSEKQASTVDGLPRKSTAKNGATREITASAPANQLSVTAPNSMPVPTGATIAAPSMDPPMAVPESVPSTAQGSTLPAARDLASAGSQSGASTTAVVPAALPQLDHTASPPVNVAPPSGQTGDTAEAAEGIDAPSSASRTNDSGAASEFSAALEKFANAKATPKGASGGESQGTTHRDESNSAILSGPTTEPQNRPDKSIGNIVQTKPASYANNSGRDVAKVNSADAAPSPNDASGQTLADSVSDSAMRLAALAPPKLRVAPELASNGHISQPTADTRVDVAKASAGGQSAIVAGANTTAFGIHGSASNASSTGQGNSGQQSGGESRNQSAPPLTLVSSPAATANSDPAGNPLTAQSAGIPPSHTSAPTPPMPQSSAQQAATLSAWQNYDGSAGKIVTAASLAGSVGSAEMHVELRSSPLGPMEIHTIVREGSVGAEIHVQGQEAHSLLAAGLPSLERALNDRNLRVENISVYQNQTGGGMGGGERQNSHPEYSPTPERQPPVWGNPSAAGRARNSSSDSEDLAIPTSGLSVQA